MISYILTIFILLIGTPIFLPVLLHWEKWANRMIEEWAAENGYKIMDIEAEPFGAWDRLTREAKGHQRVWRIWLVDERGNQSQSVAIIDPLFRRIRVSQK